jgi:putative ABC transport system substrate-binding protein
MLYRSFILFCLSWLLLTSASANNAIHLILSESGTAYQEAANAFRSGLGRRQNVKVWSLAELTAEQVQRLTRANNLVAPVGVKAARFVAEQHAGQAPVLSLMIPKSVSEKLQWPAGLARNRISAIYIDQPPSRSLALVQAAFPNARRVGLLVSPENTAVAKALEIESTRRDLRLNVEMVDGADDVSPALRRVLSESDVLLLVPDAVAINAANAQNVLLTTYRFRIPVVGFSQGLSKAGAVASVYSSPTQIGLQAGQLALRLSDTGELPPPQHAGENSIAFNQHVARSLGIVLPNVDDIRRDLGAQGD